MSLELLIAATQRFHTRIINLPCMVHLLFTSTLHLQFIQTFLVLSQ